MSDPKKFESDKTIERAKELRSRMPKAEVALWNRLRRQQLGYRFRRQHPVSGYVADFACVEAKLMIELDGRSHLQRGEYDANRDAALSAFGWHIVRYSNLLVLQKIENELKDVRRLCDERVAPPPP